MLHRPSGNLHTDVVTGMLLCVGPGGGIARAHGRDLPRIEASSKSSDILKSGDPPLKILGDLSKLLQEKSYVDKRK